MLQSPCSYESRCSPSLRARWKVILTREVESLALRGQRATAHEHNDLGRRCGGSAAWEGGHGACRCRLTCSSRCSSSLRVRWKMTLTREVEGLAARCQRATAQSRAPSWRWCKSLFEWVACTVQVGSKKRPFHCSLKLVSLLTLGLLEDPVIYPVACRNATCLFAITRVAPSQSQSRWGTSSSSWARLVPEAQRSFPTGFGARSPWVGACGCLPVRSVVCVDLPSTDRPLQPRSAPIGHRPTDQVGHVRD